MYATRAPAGEGHLPGCTGQVHNGQHQLLIEIDHQTIGERIALAGEDVPACHLIVFEAIAAVHLHFTFDDLGAAR